MSKESIKKEIESLCQSILASDLDAQCSMMIHKMGKVYNHLLVYNYLNLEAQKAEKTAQTPEKEELIEGNPAVHELRKGNLETIEIDHEESQELQVEERIDETEHEVKETPVSESETDAQKTITEVEVKEEQEAPIEPKAEEIDNKTEDTPVVSSSKRTLADLGENAPTTVYERLAIKKELSIGLNDKFAFIRDLFDGDASSFKAVMDKINALGSVEEAKSFFTVEVAGQHSWGEDEEETIERFLNIIERKV